MPDDGAYDLADLSFLIIEDDPFAQTVATGLLEQMGAKDIDVAEDGLEGLNRLFLTDQPADVLLVDLSMPDMGGAEMMRHLASRQFQGSIILVSGADADTIMVAQELAKTRGLDVLGSISKPLTKQALAEALAGRT